MKSETFDLIGLERKLTEIKIHKNKFQEATWTKGIYTTRNDTKLERF